MITPQRMSEFEKNKIIDMFSKLNQDLTSSIIKKLQQNEDISSFTKAQMRVLARQGGKEVFNEALNKVNGLSRERKKQLLQLFEELQNEQMKGYKDTYEAKGLDYEISQEVQTLVDSIYRRTNKDLKNMTKSIAFSSKTTYINALDDLYTKVASGSFDYSSAMKSTINALAEKGITLKDRAGRNTSLETAVKRNLMTSLTQTANDISKQVGDEIGANCVIIGHTPHCRPTHQVIDGVIMSLDKFKEYEYLTEEPNCYHIVNYDWRPDFENKKNKILDNGHLTKEEYKRNYEIRQKQTYYARQVRGKKEQVSILNKSDKRNNATSEELKKAKKELRNAQMKYRQFSKSKGIDVDYSLTWKQGYNKVSRNKNTFNENKFTSFNPKSNEDLEKIGKSYFNFKSNEYLEAYTKLTSQIKIRIKNNDSDLINKLNIIEKNVDYLAKPSLIDFKIYSAKDINVDYSKDKHLLSGTISKSVANLHINKKSNKEIITIYVEKGAKILSTYNTDNKHFNRQGEIILPTNRKMKKIDDYNYILLK